MTRSSRLSPVSAPPATPWREALSSERLAHLLKTAFRETSRALQDRLGRHGVQYGHWTLLRVLWQTDGITQRQLAEQAGVSEPSAFTALRQMQALGYVARRRIAGNRREVRIFLAAKGAALRTVSVSAAEEVNRIAQAGLSASDLAATRQVLITIIANLEREPLLGPAVAKVPRTRRVSRSPRGSAGAKRQAA